jgi:hypothetical protein
MISVIAGEALFLMQYLFDINLGYQIWGQSRFTFQFGQDLLPHASHRIQSTIQIGN